MSSSPRCRACRYYYITWDRQRPYGCRKLGFKAAVEPALVVWRVSGHRCLAFAPKSSPPPESPATAGEITPES